MSNDEARLQNIKLILQVITRHKIVAVFLLHLLHIIFFVNYSVYNSSHLIPATNMKRRRTFYVRNA